MTDKINEMTGEKRENQHGHPAASDRTWMARHRGLIITIASVAFYLAMLIVSQLNLAARWDTTPGAAPAAPSQSAQTGVQPSRPTPPAQPKSPVQPASPAQPPPRGTTPATTHIVTAGETLSGIALRYRVPFEQIAGDSGITNPNRIKPGQLLTIKSATSGVHVIQPGATLSEYARRYGQSVDALLALNPHITNRNRIIAGSGLRVSPPGSS